MEPFVLTDKNQDQHRVMSWPAAATLIAAMVGAAATTIALAMSPQHSDATSNGHRYATAREIGDVKARLGSLEQSTQEMRVELRTDIKELRDLITQLINQG